MKKTAIHLAYRMACGFFLSLFYSLSQTALAAHPSPFLSRNQSPFAAIYGLPLATSAQLLNNKQSRWISSLNISNTINQQRTDNEALFIDVETWRLNLLYDYSFKQNWMLRLQLPYIEHSSGNLDSAIDAYHNLFGFPQGLRPQFPQDQLALSYEQSNNSLLNISQQQQAMGDISLQLAWQSSNSLASATSYWLSLKLPTGDYAKLTGSGAADLATWVSSNLQLQPSLWIYGQFGLLYMGDSKVLSRLQKKAAGFSNIGLQYQAWKALSLKAQLDMHSAFYRSELEFLGHVLQITFGGSYQISNQQKIDFAVAEDLKNNASPDVNFNLSWWHSF